MVDYSKLRRENRLGGTIVAAKAKRDHRDNLARHPARRTGYRLIPIGDYDLRIVTRLAKAARPRVRRWVGARARNKSVGATFDGRGWGVHEDDAGRYSARCRYRKIDYGPWVSSYGYVTATHLVARIWDSRYRYRAPRGWVFGRDDLGIYIVRLREKRESYRYHLSSDDVRGGLSAIRAAGIRHEIAQRAATKRARLLLRADKVGAAELARYGVWISVADSRKAGNCASGTIAWALQNGLDPGRRYPSAVIARLAATHPSVSRVLAQARHRTREELAQGFCLI
jgi:hypothetical protein